MAMFKAFKPSGMEKIARSMGYQGSMDGFQNYLSQDPMRQQQMSNFQNKAMQMAKGGMVNNYKKGGAVPPRRTEIKGQDHMLAYITPQEGELLKAHGGSGRPGPMGIPSFDEGDGPGGSEGAAMSDVSNFYYVPVGQGADATSRRIYIGSSQDTVANRQAGSSSLASATQGTSPGILARDVPYEVAAAANPDFAAAQEALAALQAAPEEVPVEDTIPQGPTDLTGQYSDQLANSMANNVQTFGTTFRPNNTPPLLNTAFVDNTGQTYINTSGVQRAVAGQPIMPTYGTQVQGYATGGSVTNPTGTQAGTPTVTEPSTPEDGQPGIGQFTVEQMYQPGVPIGGTTIAAETPYDESQDIAAGTGTLTGSVNVDTATAAASQAQNINPTAANTMQVEQVAGNVNAALDATQAAQSDPNDPRLNIQAAQQTQSSVGNLQAAQGNAFLINSPVQRQLQSGELISGTGVDAAKAAALTAQTQAAAAQANPSAQTMVANQLDGLMQDFDGGATPAWAAGAMRAATAAMAGRGLGASSLAGQAVVQAAMESAMPIAMADSQTVAKFESQNLSNRQQSAMLAAEQRAKFMGQEFDQVFQTKVMNASKISDIANQNFTAEQQVQLENSRAVNTMNLANLNNKQSLVMAEAAALAQLDVANLSNRQQAAVQNAQNFLQVDMANLSNRQQTELFQAQQRVQALFTDQAATNAAAQFNASSQNQTDQFFQQLGSQVSQFNATQQNAQAQFNAGQTNTVNRFNAEINNQRDQFNANNQMVIAQANATWRRQIATADTAAVNRANELNANAILDISKQAYSNLWNYYADTMEWAWTSAENEIDRNNALAIAELDADTRSKVAAEGSSGAAGNAIGSLIGTLGSAWILSGGCWVAREVYGSKNVQWFIFRTWLQYDAPKWFKKLYMTHGENYAKLIAKVPPLKWATKKLMDMVVENKREKHNVSCAH